MQAAGDSKGIFVTGEGEVTVKPDVAYITLGVETQLRTAQDAQRENARLIGQMITKLTSLGIAREKIETSNYNLWPVRNFVKSSGTEQVVGYRVTNQVLITVTELDKLGSVVDAAVSAGANNVQGISFSVRDAARAKAEAMKAAAKDARVKAEALAESMGLSLSGIISMTDQNVSVTPPRVFKEAFQASAADAGTQVTPGDLKVQASVQVNFAIK
jgi:uncharacterized protein YggE